MLRQARELFSALADLIVEQNKEGGSDDGSVLF